MIVFSNLFHSACVPGGHQQSPLRWRYQSIVQTYDNYVMSANSRLQETTLGMALVWQSLATLYDCKAAH